MTMPKTIHRNSACQIDQLATALIPYSRTFSAHGNEACRGIIGYHDPVKVSPLHAGLLHRHPDSPCLTKPKDRPKGAVRITQGLHHIENKTPAVAPPELGHPIYRLRCCPANQARRSFSATTSPTMIRLGLSTRSSIIRLAISSRVPKITRCCAVVPRSITATGVSAARPLRTSWLAITGRVPRPM